MDMLEEIKSRLAGKNLSEVSRRAGMAYGTVFNLARGSVDDIYVSTYNRIAEALDSMEAEQCNSDPTK